MELELNFETVKWSWSGVDLTRSGVGVELELRFSILEWSWSGAELLLFSNSDSTPTNLMFCKQKWTILTTELKWSWS